MQPRRLAFIPFQDPRVGKTRLADLVGPDERGALSVAMLTDVVAAVGDADLDRVVIVAASVAAASIASRVWPDTVVDDRPLNVALDATIDANSGPTDHALVVVADLPRLTAADVRAVLATDRPVVIAPTADGGTGALLRRPATVIGSAYGPESAARHAVAAERALVTALVLDLEGFRDDIDTAADVAALDVTEVGPATAVLLRRSGLAQRLAGIIAAERAS